MEVNDALVQQLAELARLEFNQQEKAEIRGDLQRMITFVEKLNELDTTQVDPLLHLTEDYNVFREDKVIPSITREEGLLNAPAATDEYFKVPKIIKK
ncbi:Asp-tRNA(Asn)/Glu-tRNA(Gln) amidotransferase subunit GatC [Chitinophaga nivalis]|uniref:Aspartyl/glutamyl-tRNA(Asn/Gln) amidotransferase subunit C n=1 Tax=Chitinophaga nivalis TaxID=2991709 RepID=A0ABT3IF78_9BACT|nr:Asp-tRNA(Asn)/Glu-tRNA(Gln) amidotransferase subunit GatC [Chitinophaga nivalis]MCW3467702.1 Asp-tRNA(Asn)/Glu-tRNA(Gln) amidotransferase subunit GatC [Chitinophaga nivalis]MCW3482606.1 Asp-tRNA(Asn)/Glu-tRNA(Gln) amidotransferase subunit GatC [Chitinophaga nivalis]